MNAAMAAMAVETEPIAVQSTASKTISILLPEMIMIARAWSAMPAEFAAVSADQRYTTTLRPQSFSTDRISTEAQGST
jgi:hypothetical protein